MVCFSVVLMWPLKSKRKIQIHNTSCVWHPVIGLLVIRTITEGVAARQVSTEYVTVVIGNGPAVK